MSLIELINQSIDPFLMQLVIVPCIVIGFGVFVSIVVKKILIPPIITLILNILYERYFLGCLEVDLGPSSWNVTFTIVTLIISLIIIVGKSPKLNKTC